MTCGGSTTRRPTDEDGTPAQVHVRHRWPPRLEPPAHGRVGADAALGIRQSAQGLAAHAPPGRRGLGV